MWKNSLLAAAVLCGSGLVAAEPSAPSDEKKDFAKIQLELKAKYPAEVEAIQKLAVTDIVTAMEQYRALCRKSGVRLPMPRFPKREGGRGGEFGSMMPPDGGPDMDGGHGMHGGRSRRNGGNGKGGRSVEMAAAIKTASAIKERFPQEYASLNKDLTAVEDKYETLAVKVGADINAVTPMDRNLRRLEAKKPAEFDAAARLMKENMREGMIRLRELAEQEGIVLNMGRRGSMGGSGDAPAFSSSQTRVNPARRMKMIREKYPEEMKKFDELRRTDPVKAQELLRELNRKMDENGSAVRRTDVPVFALSI